MKIKVGASINLLKIALALKDPNTSYQDILDLATRRPIKRNARTSTNKRITARKARPKPCPACGGKGTYPSMGNWEKNLNCPKCLGTGKAS